MPGTPTLSGNELMVEAAAGGLGIVLVPERLTRPASDRGRPPLLLVD